MTVESDTITTDITLPELLTCNVSRVTCLMSPVSRVTRVPCCTCPTCDAHHARQLGPAQSVVLAGARVGAGPVPGVAATEHLHGHNHNYYNYVCSEMMSVSIFIHSIIIN